MSVEEHEEIPWSMLVDQDRRGRSRTWYAVAAVIIAVVVGFVGVRWVEGNRHGEGLADVPPLESPVATTAAPVPTTAALLSEADLMAVDPTTMGLAAVPLWVNLRHSQLCPECPKLSDEQTWRGGGWNFSC